MVVRWNIDLLIVRSANRVRMATLPKLTREIMRKAVLLLGTLALADCSRPQTIYLRLDGQDIANNPALVKQLDLDRKVCEGEPSGDDNGCMAVKGYVSVPPDQAAEKQRLLAAIAAQNAALKNVDVPPPSPAAAKKQKSNPPTITLRSSQN
jgi:hypothetical protein